jgi:hypothetical protein
MAWERFFILKVSLNSGQTKYHDEIEHDASDPRRDDYQHARFHACMLKCITARKHVTAEKKI